jgi:hypothetical protein
MDLQQSADLRWTYLVTQLVFAVLFGLSSIGCILFFVKHRLSQRIKFLSGIQMVYLSLAFFTFTQTVRLGVAELVMSLLDSLDPFVNLTTRNCLNILSTTFFCVCVNIVLFIWVKNFFIQFRSFDKVLSTLFSTQILIVLIVSCICLIIYSIGMIVLQDGSYQKFHYAFIGGYGSLIFVYMIFSSCTLAAFTYLIYQEMEGVHTNIVDNGRLLVDEDDDEIQKEEEKHFTKKTNTSLHFLLVSGGLATFFVLVGCVYLAPSIGHVLIAATGSQPSFDWYDYVTSLIRLILLFLFTVYAMVVFFVESWTSPEVLQVRHVDN